MRAAQIINGLVANILEVNSYSVIPGLVDAQNANIGDGWDGAKFIKPVPPATPIPSSVTMRQARLALNAASYYAAVNAAVAAGSDADKIEWEYAGDVYRNAGLVPRMASALGLTSAQIDALFVMAATL